MKASVRKFRTFIRLVLMLIVLALVLGGIFGWKYLQMQKMQKQMSEPEPPALVEATRLSKETLRPAIKAVGSLRAINGIEVANEVDGTVSELHFESGDEVEKGDILVQLDDSVDQAALEALQAQAQQARETFRRYSDLLPRKAVSRSEYDEAQANYQAAQANVAQQQAQLNKKTIRAPFDGVVGLRQVDLGEYIAVGTPIVELNMLDPIYVDYSVPERQLTEMSRGRKVEVQVAAYPDDVFRGEIHAVSNSVDQSSRTLQVRARLANEDQRLRPGMFADVRSLAPEAQAVLTLPRTALSFNTYGNYVFRIVENEDGQLIARRTQVTTSSTRGDEVIVSDGLEHEAQVVATGLLRLRDGQRVEIQEQSSSRTAARKTATDGQDDASSAPDGAKG